MAVKKIELNNMKYCPLCGYEIPEEEFYKSPNPHHNGRLLYCKKHCDEITKENIRTTKSLQKGLWYSCAELGVPFIREVYDRYMEQKEEKRDSGKLTVQAYKDYKDFYYYYNNLQNMTPRKVKNPWTTFLDTNVSYNEIMGIKEAEESIIKDMDKFLLNWGEYENIEDYHLLEFYYDELTDGVTFKNKAQEMLYRDLCQARLTKRKIENKEINDDIQKVQKQIIDLMAKLKIDNFEVEKDKTDFDLLLERQIWEIENKEPCEVVDLNMYKDMCNIESQWGKEIKRAVQNLIAGSKEYPTIEKIKQIKKDMVDKVSKKKEE